MTLAIDPQNQRSNWRRGMACLAFAALVPAFGSSAAEAVQFPGRQPGVAVAVVESEACRLENAVLCLSWQVADGRLRPGPIVDRLSGRTIPGGSEIFSIVLGDGRTIPASGMKLLDRPQSESLPANARAVRASNHQAGKCVSATLGHEGRHLASPVAGHAPRRRQLCPSGALVAGAGQGLAAGGNRARRLVGRGGQDGRQRAWLARRWPATCSSPAKTPWPTTTDGPARVRCALPWKTTLRAGKTFRCTSVVGVAPAGQMRRAFLYYVERERARPYRPFLHYNSWYDISWDDRRINEGQCLAAIRRFGQELVQKRGVRLDSFGPRRRLGRSADALGLQCRVSPAVFCRYGMPRPSTIRPWACGCRLLAATGGPRRTG